MVLWILLNVSYLQSLFLLQCVLIDFPISHLDYGKILEVLAFSSPLFLICLEHNCLIHLSKDGVISFMLLHIFL